MADEDREKNWKGTDEQEPGKTRITLTHFVRQEHLAAEILRGLIREQVKKLPPGRGVLFFGDELHETPGGRQSGQTTRQLLSAPDNAVYIAAEPNPGYTRHLARYLGRPDIRIHTQSWLQDHRWQGCRNAVILDHACQLTEENAEIFHRVTAYLRCLGLDE